MSCDVVINSFPHSKLQQLLIYSVLLIASLGKLQWYGVTVDCIGNCSLCNCVVAVIDLFILRSFNCVSINPCSLFLAFMVAKFHSCTLNS